MDAVRSIQYSESSRVIVTGSWDASIMVWDTRTLQCVGNHPQVNEVRIAFLIVIDCVRARQVTVLLVIGVLYGCPGRNCTCGNRKQASFNLGLEEYEVLPIRKGVKTSGLSE